MIVIINLSVGFIMGGIVFGRWKTYFNSKAKSISDKGFWPEFEVTNIEWATDAEYNTIARYTVVNCFFSKKDNRDFKYQKFYFYDKIDAYKVGDKLTINKLK